MRKQFSLSRDHEKRQKNINNPWSLRNSVTKQLPLFNMYYMEVSGKENAIKLF